MRSNSLTIYSLKVNVPYYLGCCRDSESPTQAEFMYLPSIWIASDQKVDDGSPHAWQVLFEEVGDFPQYINHDITVQVKYTVHMISNRSIDFIHH